MPARLNAALDFDMKTLMFILIVVLPSLAGAVCLDPPGTPSPKLEDKLAQPRFCALDGDCVVLGCFSAYNQTAAKYARDNPGFWYTINCDKSVHDEMGQCVLTAKCEKNRCVLGDKRSGVAPSSE